MSLGNEFEETKLFFEDLKLVLEKHNMILIMSNNTSNLVEQTKHLEGFNMFFTKGLNKKELIGGEPMTFEASPTLVINREKYGPAKIKIIKNRYTKDEGTN